MIKNIFFSVTILFCFGAFTSLQAQKTKQDKSSAAKNDVKFLDDISVNAPPIQPPTTDPKAVLTEPQFTSKKLVPAPVSTETIENANLLQIKYALLLDMEVERIQNLGLFKVIDEWFGTKYKLGGNTKEGIDCSALMQILFTSLYGITLPRTAREQFNFSRKISRTELREGDLIFFNTIGGVSHVGMYLQNNKFVHASSGGVTISDLYEEYWLKHFIGVGRVESLQQTTALSSKP